MAAARAKKETTDDGDELVQGILQDLKKEFGDKASISIMGEGMFAAEPREWLSTGLTLLDHALKGGIPIGRIVEIFGDVATAKSMLLGTIIAEAQKKNAICALNDTEQAYSIQFIRDMCHADPDRIYYLDPDNLEDLWSGVDIFIDKVRERETKRPILIGIDSLAGLPPRDEAAAAFDEHASMALAARINKRAMRKLTSKLTHQRVAIVMTNQEMAKINAPAWAEQRTTSGGFGPRYHSSIRLRMEQIKKVTEQNELVGKIYRVSDYKNRFTFGGHKIEFLVDAKRGIDDVESVVTFLTMKHQLGSKKGFVEYGGEKLRPKQFREKAREDPQLWEQLTALAQQTLDRTVDVDEDAEGAPEENVDGVA